jgi:hypothetical protein
MKAIKIHQFVLIPVILCGFLTSGKAQLNNYTFNAKGDTINGLNKAGEKQGKWVIRVEEVRGEPGYEEEGIFKGGKKEGPWRIYNLTGDLIGIENYMFGGKHGVQQYFTYLGDLVREEVWKGFNPDAPYDTIPIYGTGSNEIINYKIVKAEQYSVKHGEWKYYEPGSGRLVKTEKYDHNRLLSPGNTAAPQPVAVTEAPKKPAKTPEMEAWDKKNKGKKKVVRDGRTGL